MKKLLYMLLGVSIAFAGIAYALPYSQSTQTLIPFNDNSWDLGTSTARYRNLYLSGTCTGCGGLASYDAFTHPYYGGSATTSLMTFTNGFLSTASSTINSKFFLSTLSQGSAYIGSLGQVNSIATSSLSAGTGVTFSGTAGSFIGG